MSQEQPKKKIQTGLGKGLGALIPDVGLGRDTKGFITPHQQPKQIAASSTNEIAISSIVKNPFQPRKDFDEEALDELKKSITQHGVIQPITVRKKNGFYELISGERRLRASTMAGLKMIPAYVIEVKTDAHMLEIAIIENLQREDLNPIEVSEGYAKLIEECKLTQEEVAQKVGKDRSSITNYLRLLKLPNRIQTSLKEKQISTGHARTLLGLNSEEQMIAVWQDIIDFGFSVRQTEKAVKDVASNAQPSKTKKQHIKSADDLVIEEIQSKLRQSLGTDVKLKFKSENKGSIEIEFYSSDDFERIVDLLDSLQN